MDDDWRSNRKSEGGGGGGGGGYTAEEESGEGLPYAPENWPEEGDRWGWRTGRRVAGNGYFQDRYLYLPKRLCPTVGSRKKRLSFASKLSVQRYLNTNFPNAHIPSFFSSFQWKIPATSSHAIALPIAAVPLQQIAQEQSDSDIHVVKCKAGNKMCHTLIPQQLHKYAPAMPCDMCCTEPHFCRHCSCVLCSKTISSAYDGYSYIKCQVNHGDGICAHVAHIECALRSRMAGMVGRSIGLNAEYHCRRCDGRTDLISHVNKLLQTCKATDLDEEIQKKILNLGACLLRGSQKPIAKELQSHIEMAMSKLNCETWNQDNLAPHSTGLSDHGNDAMEFKVNGGPTGSRKGSEEYLPQSLKLEAEIDEVLHDLRKSQEREYEVAKEGLQARKTYLWNLYEQLDSEKSKLASQNSSHSDALSHIVREREQQIRRELMKLEVMKKIANGFGRTSKDILKEYFGLEIAD
ncbi:putative oberon, PHD finger domain-containing protein [Lupinus albus]|uniref:Putative oberon, PHD finger domain-containing protein n=1 Tax=Lupinus albus TaxID=3870 RepID=A0A6A4QH91_LUPAL|nr:putative oberon, PHD finger domain-containing protein [Lupinus albus]